MQRKTKSLNDFLSHFWRNAPRHPRCTRIGETAVADCGTERSHQSSSWTVAYLCICSPRQSIWRLLTSITRWSHTTKERAHRSLATATPYSSLPPIGVPFHAGASPTRTMIRARSAWLCIQSNVITRHHCLQRMQYPRLPVAVRCHPSHHQPAQL